MQIENKFVVYYLESIMGSDAKALIEVNFSGWTSNNFDTEEKAIEAIVNDNMTYTELVILKRIYVRT